MDAALAVSAPVARFAIGQALMLAGGNGRPPIEVTVRDTPTVDESRYSVSLDNGLCAGLRLWAAEAELTARRIGRPEGRQ